MHNFIRSVIVGTEISPPPVCAEAFQNHFNNANHTDWYDHGDHYEAIFYKDKSEHIALFTLSGGLLEYKMYLPPGYLPELIKGHLESRGEIMNVVLRNKGNSIEYEAIVRDQELTRFLVVLSDLGRVIDEHLL